MNIYDLEDHGRVSASYDHQVLWQDRGGGSGGGRFPHEWYDDRYSYETASASQMAAPAYRHGAFDHERHYEEATDGVAQYLDSSGETATQALDREDGHDGRDDGEDPVAAVAAAAAVETPWHEMYDPQSGHMYYYNGETGESVWQA